MSIRIFTLVILVVLAGSTCSNNLNDLVIVAKLDNEFSVEAWDQLEGPERSLEILLRSTGEDPCANVELNVISSTTNNQLLIEVKDLKDLDDCQTEAGAILSRVNFGSLEPGYYNLKIDLLEIAQNEILLDVTPERYRLSGTELNGILINREETRRVPNEAFWGSIAVKDTLENPLAASFLSDLDSLTTPLSLAAGYYGYFELEANSSAPTFFEGSIPGFTTNTFLRQIAEVETIDSLISVYRSQYDADAVIQAWHGSGHRW